MSDIPEDVLCKWLRIVANQTPPKTKWFNDQCLYYKKVVWVKQAILEYALQVKPQLQTSVESYDDLATRFPPFHEGQTFNDWCTLVGELPRLVCLQP